MTWQTHAASLHRFGSTEGQRVQAKFATAINACEVTFNYLSDNLPSRLKSSVALIQRIHPLVRCGDYPVVLIHGNLNEINILVDPASGRITGVVDRAGASFQPFGFALYELDNNALGSVGPNGREYLDNADYLRDRFGSTFQRAYWEAVRVWDGVYPAGDSGWSAYPVWHSL